MKQEYDIKFKAKVGAWALDEDCGIVGASTKFDVPSDLVYEWAKGLVLIAGLPKSLSFQISSAVTIGLQSTKTAL